MHLCKWTYPTPHIKMTKPARLRSGSTSVHSMVPSLAPSSSTWSSYLGCVWGVLGLPTASNANVPNGWHCNTYARASRHPQSTHSHIHEHLFSRTAHRITRSFTHAMQIDCDGRAVMNNDAHDMIPRRILRASAPNANTFVRYMVSTYSSCVVVCVCVFVAYVSGNVYMVYMFVRHSSTRGVMHAQCAQSGGGARRWCDAVRCIGANHSKVCAEMDFTYTR